MADTPFQIWVFVIATILNLVAERAGLVSRSIFACLRTIATEAARSTNATTLEQREARQEQLNAINTELEKFKDPYGWSIGVIEREIYIYALMYPSLPLLGSALLFKGFTGWITIGATEVAEGLHKQALGRFYAYTIGNFLSLLWAILIFELVRTIFHYITPLRDALWLT